MPLTPRRLAPRETYVPIEGAQIYCRQIGEGPPIVILHGGPDFDHHYLLPDMDRLSDAFQVIYYDQRGRGKSAAKVKAEDVSLRSEIHDLETLRQHLQLESMALLGHSWGVLLALEYAIHHPDRVSHLVLMNPVPVSYDDYVLLRRELPRKRAAGDVEAMRAIAASASYKEGDLEADTSYYRIHFRATLRQPEQLENVVRRLRSGSTKEGILLARAIEERLLNETWLSSHYDRIPNLQALRILTLVLSGEHDFIPAEIAARVAGAIPGARLVVLRDCGHFPYLERPDEVRDELATFFGPVEGS